MDINISDKKIKDLCGTVSYKKGQTFYQTGKVTINENDEIHATATVKSAEDFQVRIMKTTTSKELQTSCSCESLIQFSKKCQHVAAVLIALQQQRLLQGELQLQMEQQEVIDNELFSIFDEKSVRGSGYQRHFEQRKTLSLQFVLTPIELTKHETLFALRLKVEDIPIRAIRPFLQAVSGAQPYQIAPHFTYEQSEHCFESKQNNIVQQLNDIIQDEELYIDAALQQDELQLFEDRMLIPPSTWQKLAPKFAVQQEIAVQYSDEIYQSFHYQEAPSYLKAMRLF